MQQSPQFSPHIRFTPMIDIGFWTILARKKLDEYKLDTSPRPIFGKYKINNFKDKTPTSHLFFDVYSFSSESIEIKSCSGPVEVMLPGHVIVLNTIEEFKLYDKDVALQKIAKENRESLFSKNEGKPQFEKTFELVVFADLKSHIFHYFILFPDVVLKGVETLELCPFSEKYNDSALEMEKTLRTYLMEKMKERNEFLFFFNKNEDNTFKMLSFAEFLPIFKENPEKNQLLLVFIDSYNQPNGGNTLLNTILAGIAKAIGLQKIVLNFLLIKDFFYYNPSKCVEFKNSAYWRVGYQKFSEEPLIDPKSISDPKSLDLKSFIDEASLAENAVNLNIKLMKWRLCPDLEIERMQQTKVLCFGAGTLGCQLSRNLIGWGVRNITFVDYGKVSYSNPVRQSLFNFEDSIKGGKPKAEAAAESLRKIFPSINAKGIQLEIPMPGHFISNPEQAKRVLDNLDIVEKLVQEHDALFLLTDTRESRWLPTVLANKYNKICISVALGFDSYVVIRHGMSPKEHKQEINGDRLACYFCNDILTPNNSSIDRTLDQQCTVTRPGASFIASAYASELFISLLHHSLLQGAPSGEEPKDMANTSLGILPQHIRGNISDFEVMKLYGKAFENCIACSEYVLDEYLKNRDEFILKVINSPDFLQDVTKITETLNAMDLENAIICLDEDSDKENSNK